MRAETIVAAGPLDEVMALEGPSTRVVDLGDHALLPGFIDAHGHFLGAGRDQHLMVGLHPPPVGDVNNIEDIVRKVRAWIDERDIPPGEPVTGRGYDDSLLEEGRHPRARIWTGRPPNIPSSSPTSRDTSSRRTPPSLRPATSPPTRRIHPAE